MTSTIVENNNPKELKLIFPVIAKSKLSGAIILFSSSKSGTYMTPGEFTKIGEVSHTLYQVEDIGKWEILDDVTINFKS